ncbi:MAG: FAD-binding oxidoreductase, partial [Trichodesmium sp. St11_bin5]|nr:FAD-binding oxidoreductase [Trichodesmium sp. St11_bin5]
MSLTEKILDQIPGNPLEGLRRVDQIWQKLRSESIIIPSTISEENKPLKEDEWDVVICGGTLGIIIGAALAKKGWRVALLEQGILKGRKQEWNISRKELETFVELNLLSQEELEKAIATEYNPARISFPNSPDIWVKDVLNIGVDPVYLLETLKQCFLEAGGQLFENTSYEAAVIHPDGVNIQTSNGRSFKTRLLLDAMGHFSPIVKQAREGKKPDAVCLVVGTCATG